MSWMIGRNAPPFAMNRRWEDDKKQMKKASYPSQLATFFAGGREGYEGKSGVKRNVFLAEFSVRHATKACMEACMMTRFS